MGRKPTINLLIVFVLLGTLLPCFSQELEKLEIFQQEYPRIGYFRVAEFLIRENFSGQPNKYTEWREQFSDLSGIMGKVESEELLRDNPQEQIHDWFKRYKQDFPEKFVVVHFNGRGRIPNYRLDEFFAGHWLYFEGSEVTEDLPATGGEVWIKVKDATRFRVDNGRQKKSSDDITMVKRNRDGSLDWNHAEYGRVLEIKDDSILVRRAMFGCKALEFKAGQTYAAPHVMSGPWGATRNMVWYYNLSTECPRDPKGRNCVDVLLDELAENFASGGRWETFDGVQFDAMTGEPHTGYHPSRINKEWPPDCNGDGKADGGMIGGMQTYGLGCFDFIKRLRTVVGPEKILAADGRRSDSQKSGDLSLNGIELEGFPEQDPYGFVAWSGAYNLLNQWKPATREPRFNYAALRYNGCEKFKQADLFRYYRLGVAGTCFTDSFLMANSWTSREIPPRLNEIFSGLEGRPVGWLGRPLGEAVHLAAQSRDEFKGRGKPFSPSAFRKRGKDDPWIEAGVKSFGGQFTSNKEKHLLVSPGEGEEVAAFTIKNVPYGTNEVFIELRLRSVATPKGYPEGYMRWMQANGSDQPKRYKIQYGYCGPEWTTHRYYFHNTRDLLTNESIAYNPEGQKHIDIEFRIWGPGAATEIEYITIHDAPEVVCRQFERGLVVANLSNQPIQLDRTVDTRFSKGWKLTVPAQDAVFQTLEK